MPTASITISQSPGLEDTEELLIYLPGAPTAELPEGFLGWVMGSDDTAEEELPFYGLYSEARLAGFRGDPVQEPADDPAAAQPAAADPLFSQLKDLEFYFASGAEGGAPSCTLTGAGASPARTATATWGKRRRRYLGYPASLRFHRGSSPSRCG